jgi:hypothetical protein
MKLYGKRELTDDEKIDLAEYLQADYPPGTIIDNVFQHTEFPDKRSRALMFTTKVSPSGL